MKKICAIIVAATILLGLFGAVNAGAASSYVSQDDFDGTIRGQALDIIRGDGVDLYTPGQTGDYLVSTKNTIYGPYQTVTMRGWIGVEDTEIKQFGYVIGDGEPVFSDDFFTETEAAVLGAGGDYALRYMVTMDVSGLGEEETLLMPVVKLEDGTVLAVTFNQIKYTTKPEPVEEKPVIMQLNNGNTSTPFNFSGHISVGYRFTIPEGYKLDTFTVVQSPTWNGPNTGIGLIASIYRWVNDDYEDTIDQDPLGVFEEEDHKDNANLIVSYDYIPAGEYLIELTEFTGNIGGWMAAQKTAEYEDMFHAYVDEEEVDDSVLVKMSIVVDNDPPAPTEVPTEKPTQAPTEVPTEVPATEAPTDAPATDEPATDAPVATEKASDDTGDKDNKDETKSGANTGLIIGIIAAVVVVAAVAAVIIISKKKKK